MNINALGSTVSAVTQSGESTRVRGEREEGKGPEGHAQPPGGRGGGAVRDAVAQTLSQLGVGNVSTSAPKPVKEANATDTSNDQQSAAPSTGQDVSQALHGFMHELFQALSPGGNGDGSKGNGNGAPPPPPPPDQGGPQQVGGSGGPVQGRGYGDLAGRVEGLAQSLASSEGSAASSGLSAAFENLKQALQRSGESENSTDLQTFLQALAQNLTSAGGSKQAAVGNVIRASA